RHSDHPSRPTRRSSDLMGGYQTPHRRDSQRTNLLHVLLRVVPLIENDRELLGPIRQLEVSLDQLGHRSGEQPGIRLAPVVEEVQDRKSTRLNSSHVKIS